MLEKAIKKSSALRLQNFRNFETGKLEKEGPIARPATRRNLKFADFSEFGDFPDLLDLSESLVKVRQKSWSFDKNLSRVKNRPLRGSK